MEQFAPAARTIQPINTHLGAGVNFNTLSAIQDDNLFEEDLKGRNQLKMFDIMTAHPKTFETLQQSSNH